MGGRVPVFLYQHEKSLFLSPSSRFFLNFVSFLAEREKKYTFLKSWLSVCVFRGGKIEVRVRSTDK